MSKLQLIKKYLKHNSIFMDWFNSHEVARYVKNFTVPDFVLRRIGVNRYHIRFSNLFGYDKERYEPTFCYNPHGLCWHTTVDGLTIKSNINPTFPLINELRGYTLLNNIHKGDLIIDAGASDGFITTYFAKKVGKGGRVIALEPDPSATWNYKPSNVTVVPACLSSYTGTTKLSLDTFGGSHVSDEGVLVSTISLKDLIHKYDFAKVSFIKLDIEGAEVDVISDLLELVSKIPNLIVVIASYHKIDGVESWNILEKKAKKYPSIMVKTIYPYHTTTYLVNRSNTDAIVKLELLPQYKKIYDRVWPHGE